MAAFPRALFAACLALAAALALSACGNVHHGCPGFASPGTGSGATHSVTGTVAYEDKIMGASGFTGGTQSLPVREATVEVVRCSDGQVLGSGTSTDAGAFSVDVANTGAIGAYVRVLTRIQGTDHDMAVRDTRSAVYAVRGGGFDERAAPSQDLLATIAAGIGAPFNILDNALIDIRYLAAAVGLGGGLQSLNLVWEAETTDFTAYFPGSRTVYVLDQPNAQCPGVPGSSCPDTDGYDDMVIRHEVGHFLADQLSKDDSQGGAHFITETDQDARLSWSEGWANFYGGAAGGDPDYVDTFDPDTPGDGIFFSLEDARPGVGGATAELAVAAALWDALDGLTAGLTDPDGDPADLGPVPILTAFLDLFGLSSPATFGAFWNALRLDPGTAPADVATFRDACLLLDIDLFEDDGTDDDPATGTAIATPVGGTPGTPTVVNANLAWDAAVATSDVDHFRVVLDRTKTYTIETRALSDGADTVLKVLDAAGADLAPTMENDNYNGFTYQSCDTTVCPPNGPFPTIFSREPLSSRLFFTPPSDATYVIQVSRSLVAPPSAGIFGGYQLRITVP